MSKMEVDIEYPVKFLIATLQLQDNDFWRNLTNDQKRDHFIDRLLPRCYNLHLTTEDLKYLHRSIEFVYDAREVSYNSLFNSVTMEFIIRFKHEKDILFWTMYCKDPKAKGKLVEED